MTNYNNVIHHVPGTLKSSQKPTADVMLELAWELRRNERSYTTTSKFSSVLMCLMKMDSASTNQAGRWSVLDVPWSKLNCDPAMPMKHQRAEIRI